MDASKKSYASALKLYRYVCTQVHVGGVHVIKLSLGTFICTTMCTCNVILLNYYDLHVQGTVQVLQYCTVCPVRVAVLVLRTVLVLQATCTAVTGTGTCTSRGLHT